MSMSTGNPLPRVYTLPACPKCDRLKRWLDDKGVKYVASNFTTDVQLEMIMKNMFGNPPILENGDSITPSEELFPNEELDEEKAQEVLSI